MAGIGHFWQQSDGVIQSVAFALLLMSVLSWTIVIVKIMATLRVRKALQVALNAFWQAPTVEAALQTLQQQDKNGVVVGIATEGIMAAQAHANNSAAGIGAGVGADEFILRSLQVATLQAQARVESGLTLLASVGSTAPFVGLFGTVWGIYHALIGLAGATQVVLDKVAGPVGEALVMTAAGLFVAIPAVLAYNAFTRVNRLLLTQMDCFAHRLHTFLVSGMKPSVSNTMATSPLRGQGGA